MQRWRDALSASTVTPSLLHDCVVATAACDQRHLCRRPLLLQTPQVFCEICYPRSTHQPASQPANGGRFTLVY
uniref:Putative secreted protein n=1 Tax=Anopheles darlingi TaxID=43151 RepID=A0A2M4DHI0_ANODA